MKRKRNFEEENLYRNKKEGQANIHLLEDHSEWCAAT